MPAKTTRSKSAKPEKDDVSSFENAMNELEGIVEKMESGDLALEESLKLFERGDQLAAQCRDVLAKAELRIETLKAKSVASNSADSSADEDDDGELF